MFRESYGHFAPPGISDMYRGDKVHCMVDASAYSATWSGSVSLKPQKHFNSLALFTTRGLHTAQDRAMTIEVGSVETESVPDTLVELVPRVTHQVRNSHF